MADRHKALGPCVFARIAVALVLIALPLQSGCYYYEISQPGEWAPATDIHKKTVWSFAWGLLQEDIHPENCMGCGLASVRVSTNFLFIAISILTLGQAVPVTIEWQCAKKPTPAAGGF